MHSLHCAVLPLHYTWLHYFTLNYITLFYIALHYTIGHYGKLHCSKLHYPPPVQCTELSMLLVLLYSELHYTTSHYITSVYIALHYITLLYIPLHYPHQYIVHCIALLSVTLQCSLYIINTDKYTNTNSDINTLRTTNTKEWKTVQWKGVPLSDTWPGCRVGPGRFFSKPNFCLFSDNASEKRPQKRIGGDIQTKVPKTDAR